MDDTLIASYKVDGEGGISLLDDQDQEEFRYGIKGTPKFLHAITKLVNDTNGVRLTENKQLPEGDRPPAAERR